MARPKGSPKMGGRQKGTPNRKTDLLAKCEAMGIDVFDELLSIAAKTIDPSTRFGMFRDIASYLYAKKKEVLNLSDHTVEELIETAEKKLSETDQK